MIDLFDDDEEITKDISEPSSLWINMPEFTQNKIRPFFETKIFIESRVIFIRFNCSYDFEKFISLGAEYRNGFFYFKSKEKLSCISGQKITEKTKSIWFPFKPHCGSEKSMYISTSKITNRYPVYIVSKGRYNNGLTTKALQSMGVKHFIVCEEFEREKYQQKKTFLSEILVLPANYLEEYDTFDRLGFSKSKGPGAARNFCIDHSKSNGFKRHWVMDDNIDAFHYLNRNEKLEVYCASTIAACEDFNDRFLNVPISGMNYYSFCKANDKLNPFTLNTRVYSCLLIDNESNYRWRGRYNEDTDICLRVLKDGFCTILFNAFLCGKVTTQRMRGGNSKDFYDKEGTLPKSEMLALMHSDVAKVAYKFNRWHHIVDYSSFKKNRLICSGNIKNIEYGLKKILIRKDCGK